MIKIIFIFHFTFIIQACSAPPHFHSWPTKILTLPSHEIITVYVASNEEDQKKGLSGIKIKNFQVNEAMLFPADKMRDREFWMPETFFPLDIIFMNEDYYVLSIQRNVPAFSDKATPMNANLIPRTRRIFSQHVLEMRADSHLSQKIQTGMFLKIR